MLVDIAPSSTIERGGKPHMILPTCSIVVKIGDFKIVYGSLGAKNHIHCLVQDCGNSSALVMELPQIRTKPLTWYFWMKLSISYKEVLVQNYLISYALVMEIWQFCMKISISYFFHLYF